MKKTLIAAAIAVVAVLLALALIVYFDPFSGLFDRITGNAEEKDESFSAEFSVYYDEGAEKLPKEAETLLRQYFTEFYKGLGGGSPSLRPLFFYNSTDCAADELAINISAALEKESLNSFSFDKCRIKLKIISGASTETGYFAVRLNQSASVGYGFLPDGEYSESGVVLHDFMLKLSSGNWKIYSHSADGGLWEYGGRLLEQTALEHGKLDYTFGQAESFSREALASVQEQAAALSQQLYCKTGSPVPEADLPYDRQAAVSYALRWASGDRLLRNLDSYADFDNDSANFVSQCLFAGGIPFDLYGNGKANLWKYYGSDRDNTSEETGCTSSWYDSDTFFSYCEGNSGRGICAAPGVSPTLLEGGDIVQLLRGDKATFTAIITGVISDENGVIDLLITSHSPELVNVPLSSLPCDGYRFIKITGSR